MPPLNEPTLALSLRDVGTGREEANALP